MISQRLLLISSSQVHGKGYMDHCLPEILTFLGEGKPPVLFIPFAKKDYDSYAEKIRKRFARADLQTVSIHTFPDPIEAVQNASAIFIGGGNTFLLLRTLYSHNLVDPIRIRIQEGALYMGSSAGSNVACATIKTTNDMPIVYPPSFEALNLVPFNINPHYIDPDPTSTHAGETRPVRIREFHEWNDNPVIGLREKAMLLIENRTIILKGEAGAKLFNKNEDPRDFEQGSRLDFLLD